MSNGGLFQLGLMDVSGRPVKESKLNVGFVRVADNKTILAAAGLSTSRRRAGSPSRPSRRRRTSSAR